MNITKQIFKKSVLVGTIALSIAVFAGCSDSANSSTADTTKPTEAQTTVQATEGTAKSSMTNESFDLKSLHTCKENDEDDLVGTWQITSGEGSQYASFYYMFNGEGKSILISGTSGYFGKSLLLVSACSLWILGACTGDFMETNTDPNAVTEEELSEQAEKINDAKTQN